MTAITKGILDIFTEWYKEAGNHSEIRFTDAMHLATADLDGNISSRIVLLKQVDADGFVFFTNYKSHKGAQLAVHPRAALCFYWDPIGKQVRIEGRVEKTSAESSDTYFATRPRESQIGAWASQQSSRLASRDALMQSFREYEAKFDGKPVPRPPHWGGYRLIPDCIEFWQESAFRLHERRVFRQTPDGWTEELLYP